MYTVVLALMSAAGAWVTWRRNPMYSTSSTLRLLGVTLLSIAALVFVIIAAIDLTKQRSEGVVLATMFSVVVAGALAMIFIIMAVSTPKDAKLTTALPKSVKLVHVHRQKAYTWMEILALTLVGCAALGLLVPGNAKYVAMSLGGIVLLLALILVPVGYVTALQLDRALTVLEHDPWVHWQYSPAQWQSWIDVQVSRLQAKPPAFVLRRDWRKLAGVMGAIAAGVLFFSPGSLLSRGLYLLAVCGVLFALVMWSAWGQRGAAEKMRGKLLRIAPEVFFGHDGVFCDGVFATWLSINNYLTAATIDAAQPRCLVLGFEKVMPSYAGNQTVAIEQRVLIPAGAQSDIAKLQSELKVRCPKARIELG